jgi:unsaturated chondroitin disaccharide hydrolase
VSEISVIHRVVAIALVGSGLTGCGFHAPVAGEDPAVVLDSSVVADSSPPDAMSIELHDGAVLFSRTQLRAMARTFEQEQHPVVTGSDGVWQTQPSTDWRSGFFAGTLWLTFEQTRDVFWFVHAQAQLADLEKEKLEEDRNDTGFKLLTSFGPAYRLTDNDAYRQILLTAATTFTTSWDPEVGAINSFHLDPQMGQPRFGTVVDFVMNLELLTWAASHGGSSTLRDMAIAHARNTLANHVRDNGSTYHIVMFDPSDGHVMSRGTRQGAGDETTWARGQAWAIYGFTMMYRETKVPDFLDGARRTADYYLAHVPEDAVPFWDFDRPGEQRDSSAAAIAASGLLELAHIESDPDRAMRYRTSAMATLASLAGPTYLAQGSSAQSILLHGVTSKRDNVEVDVGLIYADYYFTEALIRLRTWFAR